MAFLTARHSEYFPSYIPPLASDFQIPFLNHTIPLLLFLVQHHFTATIEGLTLSCNTSNIYVRVHYKPTFELTCYRRKFHLSVSP